MDAAASSANSNTSLERDNLPIHHIVKGILLAKEDSKTQKGYSITTIIIELEDNEGCRVLSSFKPVTISVSFVEPVYLIGPNSDGPNTGRP